MKSVYYAAAALLAAAAPLVCAQGAVVINQADIGTTFNIDYTGMIGGTSVTSLSALETFVFTGTTNTGKAYNFTYALTNDSTVTSHLRSFGFDVTSPSTISQLASTGVYNSAILTPFLASLFGTTEACFAATSFLGSCAGGSDAASSAIGQTGTGSFAITFANAMSSITLDNFAAQFQSITPSINGFTSVSGVGSEAAFPTDMVSAAPEPATWAMLMIGFGFIGAALRRRTAPMMSMLRMA
jgi:hypothetical protein